MYLCLYTYIYIFIYIYYVSLYWGRRASESMCVKETVGPHKKPVIIHVTDREMFNHEELNYCPRSTIKKVLPVFPGTTI